MKTKKIKYLEYKRIQLYDERILNEKYITEIDEEIVNEQIVLWNYFIQTPITLNNFDEICDIIKYFDQLNYYDRISDKVQKQIADLSEQFDNSIQTNNKKLEKEISEKIYSLYSIFNLYFKN
ncbi:hypothetical protein OBK27_13330 [Empedobacter falsenii]